MMLRLFMVVGGVGAAGLAVAEPVHMTAADIKRVMTPGAVLAIDTPLHIPIPIKVAADGIVSGEAGALGLTLGALKDRGRWWTEGDKMCVKWFRWFDAKRRCVALKRDGSKVYWFEESGETGTATLTEAEPIVARAESAPRRADVAAVDVAAKESAEAEMRATAADAPDAHKPREDRGSVSFATAGLTDVTTTIKPFEPSAARLGAEAPAAIEERAPQQVEVHRAAPARAASPTPPRRPTSVAAVRVPKEPYKHEQLFRVAGVGIGDQLNVRSGPSEYHVAVGSIPADARKVRITGACRELWCPVRHGRIAGWVNRYYLAEEVAPQKAASNRR